MYAHLLAATVRSGQPLAAGAMLGYEGSTGLSTGAHLHFEVRRLGEIPHPIGNPRILGSETRKRFTTEDWETTRRAEADGHFRRLGTVL